MLIHMGWVGSQVPVAVEVAVERVREHVWPDAVMLHTDFSLLPDAWMPLCERLHPGMQSDLLRHAALMRHGGLWLDADVRLLAGQPRDWTAAWDRYTAIRIRDGYPIINSDIIFVPVDWNGWGLISEYIASLSGSTTNSIGILDLAGKMIASCQRARPDLFQIRESGTAFPSTPREFSNDSLVARGFDPVRAMAALSPAVQAKPVLSGPGTHLKALLSRIGITSSPNCSCNARAAQMDAWGPDECERRMDEIVGWLEEESVRRKLPFVRFVAVQAVKLAIRKARNDAAR